MHSVQLTYQDWKTCVDVLKSEIDAPKYFATSKDGQLIVATYKGLSRQRLHWMHLHAQATQLPAPKLLANDFFDCCTILHAINRGLVRVDLLDEELASKMHQIARLTPKRRLMPSSPKEKSCSTARETTVQVLNAVRKNQEAVHDIDPILHYCRVLYKRNRNKDVYRFRQSARNSTFVTDLQFFYRRDVLKRVLDAAIANPYCIPDPAVFKALLTKATKLLKRQSPNPANVSSIATPQGVEIPTHPSHLAIERTSNTEASSHTQNENRNGLLSRFIRWFNR